MMTAYFSRKLSLDMTLEEAEVGYHPGACDHDVAGLCREPHIVAQLDAMNPDDIRAELAEYGAWDEEELADDEQNRHRLVWLAAGDIVDQEAAT